MKISNQQAVKDLFELHSPDIGKLYHHPVTGAPIDIPSGIDSLTISASLLNIYLFNPDVVIIWNNKFHQHHLAIWAPYINASKYKFAIVCKNIKNQEAIKKILPRTPIWCLENLILAHQQLPVASSLKIFLYPDNERMNEHTIHNYPNHMHVHIGHGDSEKSTSANRFTSIYDYIILADKNAINRYNTAGIEVPNDRFLPIGAPTIPELDVVNCIHNINSILYTPTWEGTNSSKNFSSIKELLNPIMFYNSKNPNRLHIKLHSFLGGRDPSYKTFLSNYPLNLLSNESSKMDLFNKSDVLISDISGIISEYLYTGKPIIIPVNSKNSWLENYINMTNLVSHCYICKFDEISLFDFLQNIRSDPLFSTRQKRREELYAGAKDFNDSACIFDKALDTIELSHFWRNRRTGLKHTNSQRIISNGPWKDLQNSIECGEIILTA
jgi:hypothetical protein